MKQRKGIYPFTVAAGYAGADVIRMTDKPATGRSHAYIPKGMYRSALFETSESRLRSVFPSIVMPVLMPGPDDDMPLAAISLTAFRAL